MVPRLIGFCCNQPPILKKRAAVVPLASGDVLELGCGGGANLAFYDRARVRSLAGVDPSAELLATAQQKARTMGFVADFRAGIAEALPYASNSFDTVLTTFTLCSVQDSAETLREMRRVLRPGGKILFAEHGRAPDAGPAKWQDRIEPIWKPIAGGCHLTRPVINSLTDAGFTVRNSGGAYMAKVPRFLGWVEWGEARLG